jgi:hypothetical protein
MSLLFPYWRGQYFYENGMIAYLPNIPSSLIIYYPVIVRCV